MNLIDELEKLRLKHHEGSDCWYSCPKSGESCKDHADKTECDCGADENNAKLDEIIEYVRAKGYV